MKRALHNLFGTQFLMIEIICFVCIFFTPFQKTMATENVVFHRNVVEDINEDVRKPIAITFDDGPHPVYTPKLLDGLLERHVQASFFVTGENVEKYPDIMKRMDEEGHLIGNHTYHHIQLTNCNGERFYQELKQTNQVIKKVTGKDVEYVRPPFGSWNKKYEEQLNMFPVLWNIDPMDWCCDEADCIVRHVVKKARENAIILLHDEYDSSVSAALQIIDQLQEQGYEFVTVDRILVD